MPILQKGEYSITNMKYKHIFFNLRLFVREYVSQDPSKRGYVSAMNISYDRPSVVSSIIKLRSSSWSDRKISLKYCLASLAMVLYNTLCGHFSSFLTCTKFHNFLRVTKKMLLTFA